MAHTHTHAYSWKAYRKDKNDMKLKWTSFLLGEWWGTGEGVVEGIPEEAVENLYVILVVVFCAVSVVVLVVVWWRYFLVCFCGGVLCFFCGGFGGGGVVRAQRLPPVRSLQESCVSMQT